MISITNEIFQVGGPGLTGSTDAAVYLIVFNNHAALVDAGCAGSEDRLLQNVRNLRIYPDQIKYLLLTHCHYDHTGGAETIRKKTGCQIVAHELDACFLENGDNQVTAASWYGTFMNPFLVDHKLSKPKEYLQLGGRSIEAIHIPGHSPGSVVYLTESDGLKVLFAQDVHGPLHPSLLSDKKAYHQSLQLLVSLQADILCEGHYGIYRGKDEVTDFIESFM